jgi:hypothetical protein
MRYILKIGRNAADAGERVRDASELANEIDHALYRAGFDASTREVYIDYVIRDLFPRAEVLDGIPDCVAPRVTADDLPSEYCTPLPDAREFVLRTREGTILELRVRDARGDGADACPDCIRAAAHAERHGNPTDYVLCRVHSALAKVRDALDDDLNGANTLGQIVFEADVETYLDDLDAFLDHVVDGYHVITMGVGLKIHLYNKGEDWTLYPVRVARMEAGQYRDRRKGVLAVAMDGGVKLVLGARIAAEVALAAALRTGVNTNTWGTAKPGPALPTWEQRASCPDCPAEPPAPAPMPREPRQRRSRNTRHAAPAAPQDDEDEDVIADDAEDADLFAPDEDDL